MKNENKKENKKRKEETELRVVSDFEVDVEVARGPPLLARLPLPLDPQIQARINARGDDNLLCPDLRHAAGPPAGLAVVRRGCSRPSAFEARRLHMERALLHRDPPLARACRAFRGLGARLDAASRARRARAVDVDADLPRGSLRRLHKRKRKGNLHVAAPRRPAEPPRGAPAALPAKDRLENVVGVEPAKAAVGPGASPAKTVLVVGGARRVVPAHGFERERE